MGSAGLAIISKTAAYLLTDSCYWTQAKRELDKNWVLICVGMPSGLRNWVDWLAMSAQSSTITYGLLQLTFESSLFSFAGLSQQIKGWH